MDIESLNAIICFCFGMTVLFIWLSFWPENINFLVQRISDESDYVSEANLTGRGHGLLKLYLPYAQKLSEKNNKFLKLKKDTMDKINEELEAAGRPFGMSAIEFYNMRYVGAIMLGLLFSIMFLFADFPVFFGLLMGALVGYISPMSMLKNIIKERSIVADIELPTDLELLSVCMESGMTLQGAIKVVCENTEGLLTEEFKKVQADMNKGASALKAFEDLTKRCRSKRIFDFYRQVKMNETLGVSISEALAYQAENLRVETFEIIQQRASRAAVLVMLPVALFILPSIILILAGPMIQGFLASE